MASIFAKSRYFHVRILLTASTVPFYPFPGDKYFVFTWQKQIVPRLLSTESLSSGWQPIRLINQPGCSMMIILKAHQGNPCLYEDIVLVLPHGITGDDTPPSMQARNEAICHFWEDFFSTVYRIPRRDLIEKSIATIWKQFKGGLPPGLYAQPVEITEPFNILTTLKL